MDKSGFSHRIDLKNIKINDSFWNRYISLVQDEMIPYQLSALNDEIDGAQKSHCLENFRKAAAVNEILKSGGSTPVFAVDRWEYTENECDSRSFLGWCFQDSDVYKWLEAAAYSLILRADKKLEETADRIIDLICSAQIDNGYLDTLYIINDRTKIFTNLKDRHELYCFGHLAEAAVAYRSATGKDKLFGAACRFADLVCSTFSPSAKRGYPGHEIAELALVKLFDATGNKKYLDTAEFFIFERGRKPYYFDIERNFERTDGSIDYVYNQAHIPPIMQSDAVGHAVRGVYLYTGMAAVAERTNNNALFAACCKIWGSITKRKMYITGGIGASADKEAFSFDYDLPNDTAYCETCAGVGLAFFSRAMSEIDSDAKYADSLERVMYNTILAGTAEDGKSFFYVNPLEVVPTACKNDSKKQHIKPVRQKWFACACCPPNLARFLASLGEYICRENDSTVYLDQFIGCEINSKKGKITVSSNYAAGGDAAVTVAPLQQFELAIRIPSWCKNFEMNAEYTLKKGYAVVKIISAAEIKIKFFAKPRLVQCSNRVRCNIGKAAVALGPVIYCAEEADNSAGLHLLSIDPHSKLRLEKDMSITACGFREKEDGIEYLYGDFEKKEKTPCSIRFVPYYKWGNRGENEMSVFLRTE